MNERKTRFRIVKNTCKSSFSVTPDGGRHAHTGVNPKNRFTPTQRNTRKRARSRRIGGPPYASTEEREPVKKATRSGCTSQLTIFLQGMLSIGVKHPLGRFRTPVGKPTKRQEEDRRRITAEYPGKRRAKCRVDHPSSDSADRHHMVRLNG